MALEITGKQEIRDILNCLISAIDEGKLDVSLILQHDIALLPKETDASGYKTYMPTGDNYFLFRQRDHKENQKVVNAGGIIEPGGLAKIMGA